MASLTVQAIQGLGAPALQAAAAGGDTMPLDAKVKVTIGGTATTVTLTPVGPYIKGAPARVIGPLTNATIDEPGWKYPGHKGRPEKGRLDITYSQVVNVNTGAYTQQGA